ncbi:molybdopterin cofactor-binding domain-containing protein [Parasphaerochaeta coccoides]|uniref:Aldehyde oxidase and xanthine dehydrogenase molybdopterin binding protein n=1 Tax=Parasphaerochaeta coccoides (strain ATCC BAA-1237 / DSM 17374 / SPN1) TaxID=760011 RepID=F4GLU9_PARC1|nr:molybdopterin cofactor-binding domain-containing protein [Parasphaerochaeta coccoides]AEC02990.1 aldehyde oxidase and xanthine dehydrogenase molybdopterin binding protein [Parasphaerochaeta coccoides DSM 17374]
MEKKTQLGDVPQYHGIVLCSSVSSGTIVDISMPTLPYGCFLIEPRDFSGTNSIHILDTRMPVLTSSSISYEGQPVLALFGPDIETVRNTARSIRFSYSLPPVPAPVSEQEKTDGVSSEEGTPGQREANIAGSPLTAAWDKGGNPPPETETQVLEQTYTYPIRHPARAEEIVIQAMYDQKELNMHVPTQWPFHVRESIAEALGISKRKITLKRLPYFTHRDAYVIWPSLLGVIAAAAAMKVGGKVSLSHEPAHANPLMTIHRRTVFASSTGKPLEETVTADIDQGAFPVFTQEMQRQVMAGLLPPYNLPKGSVIVTARKSSSPPASFHGDLGYATAVSSTAVHYNAVARAAGISPIDWKIKNLGEYPVRTGFVTSEKFSILRDIINETAEKSGFQRKHAAFELQKQRKNRYSTFLNYAKGIGCSAGAGISGFSSSFELADKFSVSLRLEEKDKVSFNTSFPLNGPSENIWKNMITRELDIDPESILPVDESREELRDSGPAVLSANSGRLPRMFRKLAHDIRERRFKEPLPLEASMTFRSPAMASHTEFEGTSGASLAIELDIDTITLHPVVRHVWAVFSFGYVDDDKLLRTRIRQTIVHTLRESGAYFDNRDGNKPFTIDITIHNTEDGAPASVNSILRGLVMGAFLSALGQALPSGMSTIPVTSALILDHIREE